ncbi:MAG: STAS domain-containing protein [Clostridia bacterium]|nr:STAS domain-containing protein [Clostridia bacterium]
MLSIVKNIENSTVTLVLEGRLDANAAPKLEAEIADSLEGLVTLVLDFEKLEYISSAGLRVLLFAYKRLSGQGNVKIRNVGKSVMEIFNVTGFADIFDLE